MLGLSPLGTRSLGAPRFFFGNTISGVALLPVLQAAGTLLRGRRIDGVALLPVLTASGTITHPYAWTPAPDSPEIWTDVPNSGSIWTPVTKNPEVWS